jgi:hypothetical protein
MPFALSTEDHRRLLETSFEPYGSGYLFYRNRWSRGVPVSAEEREEYLAIPVFGSRRAFYKRIEARQPLFGPRDYDSAAQRMASALPKGFASSCLAFSIGAVLRAIYASSPTERWLALSCAVLLVLLGAWIIFYRRKRLR